MEQAIQTNKTIMCSVLFLDIVAYSKKPVSVQIAQKELFNALLAKAISNLPADDRVILDTGDGAAVTFLGDVEDALKAVLVFRENMLGEGARMDPPLQVCMGINLGPVRLVKDINGRPNIVGDGINVAQRIVGFAQPGQILVSRSYFDAASRLSQEYAGMFYHEGARADKHEREHEVYAIGQPGEAARSQLYVGDDTIGVAVKQNSEQVAEGGLQGALAAFQNASGQQRALYAGIFVSALALLIVVAVKIMHRPEAPAPQVVVEAPAKPDAASAVPKIVLTPPATEEVVVVEPDGKSATSEVVAALPKIAEPVVAKKPKTARPAEAPAAQESDSRQLPSSTQETVVKEAPAVKPGAKANVNIAIAPWGEVYLDGKKQGVSPPLDVLHMAAGEHLVEFRNTTFPPYTISIQVKAGEEMKIKHKFAN